MYVLAGALAALAVVITAITLPGYLIERNRRQAGTVAVAVHVPAVRDPMAGVNLDDLDMHVHLENYVQTVGEAHWRTSLRIGMALEDFCARSGIAVPSVAPAASVSSAMLRMRHGVHEPGWAYRPANTDTQGLDLRALRALLAAEPA